MEKKAVGKTDFEKTNFGKPDFENLSVHVPIHRKGTVDAIGWDKAGTEFGEMFEKFGSRSPKKKQKVLKDGPKDSAADFFAAVCGGTDENDDDDDVFGKATSQGKGKKTEGAPTDSKGEGYEIESSMIPNEKKIPRGRGAVSQSCQQIVEKGKFDFGYSSEGKDL